MKRKILASLLLLVMTLSLLPATALAEGEIMTVSEDTEAVEEPVEEPAEEPETIVSAPTVQTADDELAGVVLTNAVTSGTCGAVSSEDSVKWELAKNNADSENPTYTLTISGSGAMADYTVPAPTSISGTTVEPDVATRAPWYSALANANVAAEDGSVPITKIEVTENVTKIGNWAFAYTQIEEASFAECVKEYGVRIYSKCPKLTTVDWTNFKPEKVWLDETDETPYSGAAVPGNMFDQVSTLCNSKLNGETYSGRLVLPNDVTTIGTSGFYGTGFTTVDFDNDLSGVKKIGRYSFSGMAKLEKVTIPGSMTFATKDRTDSNSSFKAPYGASYAFSNDAALKTVVVEEGIQELPGSIFPGCSALETVSFPSTLTKIGHKVFDQNIKLCAVDLSKCTGTVVLEESFNCYQNKINDKLVPADIDICTFYVSNASVIESNYKTMGGTRSSTFSNIAITNGGIFPDDTKFEAGKLAAPTKEGCRFEGWYDADDNAVTTVEAGQTYHAKWNDNPSTLTTDIGEKFVIDEPTEFTFTTTANGDEGKWVIGTFNFSDAEAIDKLEYLESKDGKWYELKGDFGPSTGFQMMNATSKFRVTFKKAGDYAVTVSMKTVSDGKVLCSTEAKLTVAKRTQEKPAAPTLKDRTYTSITLNEVADNANGAKAQYSKDGGKTWQASPEFTGLTADTEYQFVVRYAKTDIYEASPASETVAFSTLRRSSGGGSSSSGSSYAVSVPSTKNGDATVSPKNAKKGDTVTITVTPDKGYELDSLTVKDANGNTVKLTDKGNGKYTFTMPGSKVTVSAEFVEEQAASTFADVPTDAYYAKAVEWAVENGITNGKANGLFGSNDPCTRGQIVTFLWRAAGSPAPKGTAAVPADVIPDSYCYDAVAWAIENGITNGLADGSFGAGGACTRAQCVALLFRSAVANGLEAVTLQDLISGFGDAAELPAYAVPAMNWALSGGIVQGNGGLLLSNASCTRAQIVTFLWRLYTGK